MAIDHAQLRELIHTVLAQLAEDSEIEGLYSGDAVELLMLTAAQETQCGTFIKQTNGGPALGIFQIEPATYFGLMDWIVTCKPRLAYAVRRWNMLEIPATVNLTGNLCYQIAVARANYYRKPGKLPSRENVRAMAEYYKEHWNTHLGKATVEGAINNYRRFAQ